MTSILTQNPRDADLWVKAFDACYAGKGEWSKKDWDALLGHCMVGSGIRTSWGWSAASFFPFTASCLRLLTSML